MKDFTKAFLRTIAVMMLALGVFAGGIGIMQADTEDTPGHNQIGTLDMQATPVVPTEEPAPPDSAIIQLIIDILMDLLGDLEPTPTPTPEPPDSAIIALIIAILMELLGQDP